MVAAVFDLLVVGCYTLLRPVRPVSMGVMESGPIVWHRWQTEAACVAFLAAHGILTRVLSLADASTQVAGVATTGNPVT